MAIVKQCENCGKIWDADERKRRFCSRKCSGVYHALRRDSVEPAPVVGARWVQLGRGCFALVDASDFDRVSEHLWCLGIGGYPYTSVGADRIRLHRFIVGHQPEHHTDHENGDKLDNRRQNLRPATCSQNLGNSKSRGGVSRFKGVFLDRRDGRWYSQIKHQSMTHNLGRFDSEEAAALAYDEAALRLFGDYARCNFTGPRCHLVSHEGALPAARLPGVPVAAPSS